MIPHSTHVVLTVIDLRQSDLPRWISVEDDAVAKADEQIRLGHDRLADFSVDQRAADVRWRKLVVLCHFSQSFREVDKGLSAIGFGDEEDIEV